MIAQLSTLVLAWAGMAWAITGLGALHLQNGGMLQEPAPATIADFHAALALRPWDSTVLQRLADAEFDGGEATRGLSYSRASVRYQPADALLWTRHSQRLVSNGELGSTLTAAVGQSLNLAPSSLQVQKEQAFLSLRAFPWVGPELQAIWQRNLEMVLRYSGEEFLVEVARQKREYATCALVGDHIPNWCQSMPAWREMCLRDDLRPKWQRHCRKLGLK